MALIRRGNHDLNGKDGVPLVLRCPPDLERFEAVWDFLSVRQWPDDKKPRDTGSIQFFSDAAGLKCRLADNDSQQVAFALMDTSRTLWECVEDMLMSNITDWRPNGKGHVRRK